MGPFLKTACLGPKISRGTQGPQVLRLHFGGPAFFGNLKARSTRVFWGFPSRGTLRSPPGANQQISGGQLKLTSPRQGKNRGDPLGDTRIAPSARLPGGKILRGPNKRSSAPRIFARTTPCTLGENTAQVSFCRQKRGLLRRLSVIERRGSQHLFLKGSAAKHLFPSSRGRGVSRSKKKRRPLTTRLRGGLFPPAILYIRRDGGNILVGVRKKFHGGGLYFSNPRGSFYTGDLLRGTKNPRCMAPRATSFFFTQKGDRTPFLLTGGRMLL